MSKSTDLIVVSRSEIEAIKMYTEYHAGLRTVYDNILQNCRPLIPILEKAWDEASEATRFNAPPPFHALEQAKQLFLTSDL